MTSVTGRTGLSSMAFFSEAVTLDDRRIFVAIDFLTRNSWRCDGRREVFMRVRVIENCLSLPPQLDARSRAATKGCAAPIRMTFRQVLMVGANLLL